MPSWATDVLGVFWVVAAAGALLGPALAHGTSLGPFDWLSQYGLSSSPGVTVHNRQVYDQITEMIPWTSLGWTQVHHGHLPLWNPSSALGTPLAFNWQTASFSIPALAGYLAPLHLAYTVQVVVALLLAGTGVYVLGRLLHLHVLACTMAAVVYELSGPVVGWLGWPVAWVMAWAGWLFAATVLVLHGRHRRWAVAFLAVAVACTIYAGQPDTLALLALALGVFVVVELARRARWFGGRGGVLRPAIDLVVGGVVGAALAAPLLLPGLQLTSASVRQGKGGSQALPLSDFVHVVVQGFDGLPVAGSRWFGASFYVRTAAYLGVVGVALAAMGVGAVVRRRRHYPEGVAFGAVAAVTAAVVFVGPVVSIVDALPSVGPVTWNRALLPLAFAMAVLAGVGTDVVVRSWDERNVRRGVLGTFVVIGIVLLVVWGVGRGHLPPVEARIRSRSFLWPAVVTAASLLVLAMLAVWRGAGHHRPGRRRDSEGGPSRDGHAPGWWAGAWLVAAETALLVWAGAPLISSSPTFLSPTPAEATLASTVGNSLVGFGTDACFTPGQLGIVPNVNAALGVRELAVYDPLFPRAYYDAWANATGVTGAPQAAPTVPFSLFCPAVTSAAVARRFGVGYVLEPPGAAGPPGTVLVRSIGGEGLYRVPGAASATLVATAPGLPLPPVDASGTPVVVGHPGPASWRLVTDARSLAVLRLHLTDVPGWHATVDGRTLALQPYAGVMLQAVVPPGRHVVVLHYRPARFDLGLVVAAAAVLGLVVAAVVGRFRTRRRPVPVDDAVDRISAPG
jgi:hypothetical protein